MILMDTHVLVWLDEASPRLGEAALHQIDTAFKAGEAAVSAISFWEVGIWAKTGRIRMDMDLSVWRDDLINQGVVELPVTSEIGIQAAALEPFYGDAADRLIAATALRHSLTLITADENMLKCKMALQRCNAGH